MTDIYNICFYGGLALTVLLLITSVILFVVLKIPRVIGELTGRTARKGIEELKGGSKGSSAVSKKEQAKYYNQDSGKITIRDAVSTETRRRNNDNTTDSLTVKKGKERTGDIFGDAKTDVLHDEEVTDILHDEEVTDVLHGEEVTDVLHDEEATEVLHNEEATDVLHGGEVTDVLMDEETTDVLRDEEATDVLRDEEATDILWNDDETSVLINNSMTDKLASRVRVLYNVIVVNTDESL